MQEWLDHAEDAFELYQRKLVFVEMEAGDLLKIACVIQQTIRHRDDFAHPMLDVCREFVAKTASTLELLDPVLAEILKRGWR